MTGLEEVGSDRLERGGDLEGDLGVVRVDILLVIRAAPRTAPRDVSGLIQMATSDGQVPNSLVLPDISSLDAGLSALNLLGPVKHAAVDDLDLLVRLVARGGQVLDPSDERLV